MSHVECTYRGKKTQIDFAEGWNKLSREQLLWIAADWDEIRDTLKKYPAGIHYWRTRLLFMLAGYRKYNMFSRKCRALMSLLPSKKEAKRNGSTPEFSDRYYYLTSLLDISNWVWTENVTLTKNLLPTVKVGGKTLHGPAYECSGMVVKEFVFVDTLYAQWLKTRDEETLNEFIACLYRPEGNVDLLSKDYTGDRRSVFNNLATDLWMPAVKKMDRATKIAITLFYQGCRVKWEKRYTHVFDASESSGGGQSGWFSVLSELPADKFGTFSEREYMPIDTVFMELERMIINNTQNTTEE